MVEATTSVSRYDRVVMEILGDTEVYEAGDGPNGPWEFHSLKIARKRNTILVYDVDGDLYKQFGVEEIVPDDDPSLRRDVLRGRLERLDKASLQRL